MSDTLDILKRQLDDLRKDHQELVGRVDELEDLITKQEFLVSKEMDTTISEEDLTSSEPTYFKTLNQYFITEDTQLVAELFENFGVDTKQILSDIRQSLPPNINELAKKYGCTEELKVLRKSNRLIVKLKKTDPFFMERGLSDIVSQYIKSFNKERKRVPLKYLKQALAYYPLQFNSFLNDIKAYKADNFDAEVEKLWRELYGDVSFNMNISADENDSTEEVVCDFKNMTPNELAETLTNYKYNARRRVGRMVRNMERNDRSHRDIKEFVKIVNKTYGLKYEYKKK